MATTMLLQDYGDGMRPATGRYRCDELEIGPDGKPIEFVGLRPLRFNSIPAQAVPKSDGWSVPKV